MKSTVIVLTALFFYSLYLLGWIWPGLFWTTDMLAALPVKVSLALALSGLLLVVYPLWSKPPLLPAELLASKSNDVLQSIIIASIFTVFFALLPIKVDYYGDASRFKTLMGVRSTELLPFNLKELFSFNVFRPKNGEITWINFVQVISYYSGLTYVRVFRLLSFTSGFLFLISWFLYLFSRANYWNLRIIGGTAILGIFGLQNFFGHEEIYAPSLVLCSWFLMAGNIPNRGLRNVTSILLLLFCIKSHFIFFLLIPVFLYRLIEIRLKDQINLKGLVKWIFAPYLILGLVTYFIILQDYEDPQLLIPGSKPTDHLFLPVYSNLETFHYTLFAPSHLWDFLLLLIGLSPVIWFLLIVAVRQREIGSLSNEAKMIGASFILLVVLLFFIHPLLSMPRDWDLFCLPTPLLLFIGISTTVQLKGLKKWIGPALGLFILGFSIHFVNSNQFALGKRYETMGKYVFKTYWINAADLIQAGIKLQSQGAEDQDLQWQNTIAELKRYAITGHDAEYAELLNEAGFYFERSVNNLVEAKNYFNEALKYDAQSKRAYMGLTECSLQLEQSEEAYDYSKKLLEWRFPTLEKSLRINLQCALDAKEYTDALTLTQSYLKLIPQDTFIRIIERRLIHHESVDSLKFMFAQTPEKN
ncbi:MAG: tetratricopeptide repeat protein [Lewinellaceae bacterium]|nr:tetratricopeptide repeat protein [Lewinellaceae bacterium]